MGTRPEHDGTPASERGTPVRASTSGVRTEYDLRMQLRQALERNAALERAMRESVAYAYGPREMADLRKLRAVLSAAGFRDPNAKRGQEPDNAKEPHS
jgi:hypothetical protein